METSTLDTEIEQAVHGAALEVFAHYGLLLAPTHDLLDCSIAGVLAFTGDGLRGNLLLASSETLVRYSCPLQARSRLDLGDWVGELANQLLGRAKNKLIERGRVITLATPASVFGNRLHLIGEHRTPSVAIDLRAEQGPVRIRVTTEWAAGFQQRPPPSSASLVHEGEIELF